MHRAQSDAQLQQKWAEVRATLVNIVESFQDPLDIWEKASQLGGIDGLIDKLQTSSTKGLVVDDFGTVIDLDLRKQCFGSNEYNISKDNHPNMQHFLELAWYNLSDISTVFVLLASIVSIVVESFYKQDVKNNNCDSNEYRWNVNSNEWLLFASILIVVIIDTILHYFVEIKMQTLSKCIIYGANDSTRLSDIVNNENNKISVIRNGAEKQICYKDILVGDLVVLDAQLNESIIIPCDGILIDNETEADGVDNDSVTKGSDMVISQQSELKTDESCLTGEMRHVSKHCQRNPIMLAGTVLLQGKGLMIAVAVGTDTQWAKFYHQLSNC